MFFVLLFEFLQKPLCSTIFIEFSTYSDEFFSETFPNILENVENSSASGVRALARTQRAPACMFTKIVVDFFF